MYAYIITTSTNSPLLPQTLVKVQPKFENLGVYTFSQIVFMLHDYYEPAQPTQ